MNNEYEIFDSKWFIQIIWSCDEGICKFNDLCDYLDISRAQLTKKLKILNNMGLVEKRPYFARYCEYYSYHLTKKGRIVLNYSKEIKRTIENNGLI
ncbi:winged helix-turn-helix transcriptional regulator [Acinetobacter baumannii]|nr:winged helix-turn-helix transcriptional regulator [Acinetobacter baumannii]